MDSTIKPATLQQTHFHGYHRLWLRFLGVLCLLAPLAHANADHMPPREVLQTTMQQMVKVLNENQEKIKTDPKLVNRLVEHVLLPQIDFIAASRWVLGKHWRRATKEQKLEFIRQFRTLLLRFYSSALAKYLMDHTLTTDMFVFKPVRAAANAKRVTINSEVHAPSGKVIPVKYSMHLTRKGWKIYDVAVEGVSVITTYRTSFANEIKQKGLDGLITSLAEKNRKLAEQDLVSLNSKTPSIN